MANENGHRGRFQAQDDKLEESQAWSRKKPLPAKDGKNLLKSLKYNLNEADRKRREIAFIKCEKAIDEAEKNGGLTICKKSFYSNPQQKIIRVDLEVNAGLAFV